MVIKKPTQHDVARRAKVSQAMVSYVLNRNTGVTIPIETRQRILDAIQELGYQPSKVARSLRSSKTYTIAGIIPDILNPFYPAFQRGIQDAAGRSRQVSASTIGRCDSLQPPNRVVGRVPGQS